MSVVDAFPSLQGPGYVEFIEQGSPEVVQDYMEYTQALSEYINRSQSMIELLQGDHFFLRKCSITYDSHMMSGWNFRFTVYDGFGRNGIPYIREARDNPDDREELILPPGQTLLLDRIDVLLSPESDVAPITISGNASDGSILKVEADSFTHAGFTLGLDLSTNS